MGLVEGLLGEVDAVGTHVGDQADGPFAPMSIPSYSFWAVDMVFLAEKPSLRDASCCRVEVVNGGDGLPFLLAFGDFADTRNPPWPRRLFQRLGRRFRRDVEFAEFLAAASIRLAVNPVPGGMRELRAAIVQYSCSTNAESPSPARRSAAGPPTGHGRRRARSGSFSRETGRG